MTVTLTSEAFGKQPGETYTGPEEAWLLAEGYAKQDGYTGPGVSDTGPTDVDPDEDPTLAENREDSPGYAADPDYDSGNLDAALANLDADEEDRVGGYGELSTDPKPKYDFDPGGVDNDPSDVESITPNTGAAAGGTVVTIAGEGVEDATAVNFDGTPGTAFTHVDDGTLRVTTPPHAAGAVDVVVVDVDGNDTVVGGFTYTA